MREVFATTPTELRRGAASGNGHRADGNGASGSGSTTALTLRLRYRAPLDAAGLLGFLGARAVPGVEELERRRRTGAC